MFIKFEDIDYNNPIWVLKYDMFFDGVKFTDCHGYYRTETDAILAKYKFAKIGSKYQIEKVYERKLLKPEPVET